MVKLNSDMMALTLAIAGAISDLAMRWARASSAAICFLMAESLDIASRFVGKTEV